jgi:hypothetical protein
VGFFHLTPLFMSDKPKSGETPPRESFDMFFVLSNGGKIQNGPDDVLLMVDGDALDRLDATGGPVEVVSRVVLLRVKRELLSDPNSRAALEHALGYERPVPMDGFLEHDLQAKMPENLVKGERDQYLAYCTKNDIKVVGVPVSGWISNSESGPNGMPDEYWTTSGTAKGAL